MGQGCCHLTEMSFGVMFSCCRTQKIQWANTQVRSCCHDWQLGFHLHVASRADFWAAAVLKLLLSHLDCCDHVLLGAWFAFKFRLCTLRIEGRILGGFSQGQLFLPAEGTGLDCLNSSALQQFVSHFLMQQCYSRCLNFSQEKQWEEDAKIKLGG